MKKVSLLLLVLMLFAALTGCGDEEPPATTAAPETVVPTTVPEAEVPATTYSAATGGDESLVPPMTCMDQRMSGNPKELSDWLITVYDETFTWTDSVGNENVVRISLPALAPVADFALEYNREIWSMGNAILDELSQTIQTQCSATILSVTYEAYLHEDLLSIVIIEQTPVDLMYYTAHTFDVEDREALTTGDLCEELLDVNYPAFLLAGNAFISEDFAHRTGDIDLDPQFYDYLQKWIPYMGAYNRQLYVGENGQVMMIYDAPSLAGASYYPTFTPFDRSLGCWEGIPTEEAAYQAIFDLMAKSDGAYTTACESILARCFCYDPEAFSKALETRTEPEIYLAARLLVAGFWEDPELLEDLARDLDNKNIREAILAALEQA